MLRECYKRDGYIIKHLYPFLASSTVQYPTDMFFIQKLLVIPPKFRPPLIFTDKMIESSISELYKVCFHYLVKIILLLRSNPSRQHSKILYPWGVWRRGKEGKHGKVGMKRKW